MLPARLLIVDDEATIRHFLVRILEREGYVVQSASDGLAALQILATEPIDLLLTDIRMNQLNGMALLEETKTRYPQIAVVLLTGHATVDTAVAALRHKAANYLLKPVKNEELIAAVAAALHAHQREQRRDQLEQVAVQFSQVLTGTATLMVDSPAPLEYGNLVLHPASYTAYHDTERLNLTLTEFRLLAQFVQSPGVALEYIHLVEAACGYRCSRQEAQEIIGTHIRNVRQKLGIAPNTPLYIEAVRGIGYRLLTLAQE